MAARHPQTHHMAGAHALAHQAPRHGGGLLINVRVGEGLVACEHAGLIGHMAGGGAEHLAQQLVANQRGVGAATQDGARRSGRRRHGLGVFGH